MPSKSLPSRPSLDHLKYQAKDLLNGHRARKLEAFTRIRQSHPKFAGRGDHEIQVARLSLSDAQLVVAREYGFQSWAKLKRHVESLNRSNAPVANPTGGSPAASSHAERVARFLEYACPDHHVRGGVAHIMARNAAARMLKQHPEITRDS